MRHLRVCIDGEERIQLEPHADACEPFGIPLSASYLEVFGHDDDGALLLAVFPLPEPAVVASEGAQHFFMTLEGGQTVAIEVSLGYGSGAEASEFCVRFAYLESAAVPARPTEPHAAEAIRLLPRPETSTPPRAWTSASPGPDDHVEPLRRSG